MVSTTCSWGSCCKGLLAVKHGDLCSSKVWKQVLLWCLKMLFVWGCQPKGVSPSVWGGQSNGINPSVWGRQSDGISPMASCSRSSLFCSVSDWLYKVAPTKNSSMPDFPMALPFSIAQYFPLSTTVQCSMSTNFPKHQLGILMTVQLGHLPSMYIYVCDPKTLN